MTSLKLITFIKAPIELCFDISRDIKVHVLSTKNTNERAVGGRTFGLCELGDEITWQATHFGISQRLTVKITKMNSPIFFEDKMIKGAFKSMRHEHHFKFENNGTEMTDLFAYETPLGLLGSLFDKLILKRYMTNFLIERNRIIKEVCEKNASS